MFLRSSTHLPNSGLLMRGEEHTSQVSGVGENPGVQFVSTQYLRGMVGTAGGFLTASCALARSLLDLVFKAE